MEMLKKERRIFTSEAKLNLIKQSRFKIHDGIRGIKSALDGTNADLVFDYAYEIRRLESIVICLAEYAEQYLKQGGMR